MNEPDLMTIKEICTFLHISHARWDGPLGGMERGGGIAESTAKEGNPCVITIRIMKGRPTRSSSSTSAHVGSRPAMAPWGLELDGHGLDGKENPPSIDGMGVLRDSDGAVLGKFATPDEALRYAFTHELFRYERSKASMRCQNEDPDECEGDE